MSSSHRRDRRRKGPVVAGRVLQIRGRAVATGTVTVDVAANTATDAAGNGNTAATQVSSAYTEPVIATLGG